MVQEELKDVLGEKGILRDINVIQFYAEELNGKIKKNLLSEREILYGVDYIIDNVSDLYKALENISEHIRDRLREESDYGR